MAGSDNNSTVMIRKTLVVMALVAAVFSHPGYVAYPTFVYNQPQQVTLNPTDVRDFWASVNYTPADLPINYVNNVVNSSLTQALIDGCLELCEGNAYNPVCGYNDVTYPNVCSALCNQQTVKNLGQCSVISPLGCSNCQANGFAPVCSNGVSYPNKCAADCLGITSTDGCCCVDNTDATTAAASAGCCFSEIYNFAVINGWF